MGLKQEIKYQFGSPNLTLSSSICEPGDGLFLDGLLFMDYFHFSGDNV